MGDFSLDRLAAQYLDYNRHLVSEFEYIVIDDPTTVSLLRDLKTVPIHIGLDHFDASRREIKVQTVFVSLVGASANQPTVSVLVRHDGASENRSRDGSVITQHQAAREAPVTASTVENWLGGSPDSLKSRFYGRSPATTWSISTEPQEAMQANLDLSNLKRMVFGLLVYSWYPGAVG